MIHSLRLDRRSPLRAASHAIPWLALLACALLALPAAAASAATVVTPWGGPDVQEFPPESPPTDPPLRPGEDADATPYVEWSGGALNGSWDPATGTFTVGSVGDVTVGGHTLIRLPTDADSSLAAHEAGHDSLNHYEYDQNARKKFDAAARGLVGRKFKGEGATDSLRQVSALAQAAAARDSAMNAARLALLKQMDVINAAYDKYTDHGLSPTVDTIMGIQQAIAHHYVAPPAGLVPRSPDPAKSFCSAYGGSQGFYEEFLSQLVVAGPGLVNEAQVPMDPIVGRGWIQVDPFIVIGPQENGTVLLSDTYVRIVDSATGDTLMDGFLAEAAAMPSNVPGYLGMVQAYLDVPPSWAEGFHNTIGSPFLAGLEAACEVGEMTTAWLYSPMPMFDPLGNCLLPTEGVPLTLTLGVASPVSGVPQSPPPQPSGLAVSPQPARGAVRFAWKPVTTPVQLEVYDLAGARRWAARADGSLGHWDWPGRDAEGRPLHAGVYFARLHGAGLDLRARVVLTR